MYTIHFVHITVHTIQYLYINSEHISKYSYFTQIYCITIAQILEFNIEQLKLFDIRSIQTILEQCNYIFKKRDINKCGNGERVENNILVNI